jgi:CBS domain-containing protein
MTPLALRTVRVRALPIPGADPWYANPDDPALSVMTDFRERASVTVSEAASVDTALGHMKHNGVRCAFAVDEARHVVVGLITAYDIVGEKPMLHLQHPRNRRHDVLVRDIMQDVDEWRVVDIKQIEQATVRAVAHLFDEARVTHIPVMEMGSRGEPRLRGLLSGARVKRLLSRPPMSAAG